MLWQVPTTKETAELGEASYYASRFNGRSTASGAVFSNDSLTAAHRILPFGTIVKVVNQENKKEILLRINDRGPFIDGRIIDVTQRAAKELGFFTQGVVSVSVEIMQENESE